MKKCCPFCKKNIEISLVRHIRSEHGEDVLREAVLSDKRKGLPDVQIGEKYGISFNYLERVITKEYGANVSAITSRRTKIVKWEPKYFKPETTTVWSFKNRGNWATHDGRYRGNWSPYIPRNLILRYSKPGDVVLDYFIGGGTTAVEAKLLGRRCLARDINPDALELTKENLDFHIPQDISSRYDRITEPELELGDARDLSHIKNDSIDFICAHPPYAGIISYSANAVDGDLSTLSVSQFVVEMEKVAHESYRVLKPGHQCSILIGDSRKSKRVVPIGFLTIRAFMKAGFFLRELIIKRQHNCKTTGFWYSNSIRYNFLLLAHEYLPVFEKPVEVRNILEYKQLSWLSDFEKVQTDEQALERVVRENLETTSVWIFPYNQMQDEIRRNILGRFASTGKVMLEVEFDRKGKFPNETRYSSAYIYSGTNTITNLQEYLDLLAQAVIETIKYLEKDGFCVIETRDFRKDNILLPMGLLIFEHLGKLGLELREIVIVTSEENRPFETPPEGYLGIAHKYLFIYRKQ